MSIRALRCPPSIGTWAPCTKLAFGETRKATRSATSSGSQIRPNGMLPIASSWARSRETPLSRENASSRPSHRSVFFRGSDDRTSGYHRHRGPADDRGGEGAATGRRCGAGCRHDDRPRPRRPGGGCGPRPRSVRVGDIDIHDLVTIRPDADIEEARRLMAQYQLDCILVVE